MKQNIGNTDAAARLITALIIGGFYFSGIIDGTIGLVLIGIAGALALTAYLGWCPLYSLLKISTLPSQTNRRRVEKSTESV